MARRRLGRWWALICLPLAFCTVALMASGGGGTAGSRSGQVSTIVPVTYPLPNTAIPLTATMTIAAVDHRGGK